MKYIFSVKREITYSGYRRSPFSRLELRLFEPKSEAVIRWIILDKQYSLSELRTQYKSLKTKLDKHLESPVKA